MSKGVPQLSDGTLQGIRVVDLSRVLAGPWASQLLADYGADVIKIERPGRGDDTRAWGPPWVSERSQSEPGESAYFHATNRNKRSITVNLAHPNGQEIVRRLAASADVLLENFKVGDLDRYNLSATDLQATNQRLIYCSVSAFGQEGSRAAEPGYDAMIQASAGLMSLTGEPEEAGGTPQKVGVAIADIMAGMYAVTAILAALHERSVSGYGQHIDIPLYDSQVAWLANQNMNYLVSGEVPRRYGSGHPNLVPYQAFATLDGYLMLAIGNERQFRDLARCLKCPELADDEDFASNAARIKNRERLINQLSVKLATRTTADWLSEFAASHIPAGPINTLDTVLGDDYARERNLVRQLPGSAGASVPSVANPVRFSRSNTCHRVASPSLGEHTAQILADELGYDEARIQSLRDEGAI